MSTASEVERLARELEDAVKAFRRETRQALDNRRPVGDYTPWASQEEKLAHWPDRWFLAEAMCQAVTTGDGSGEGSLTRPGWQACARPAGHRDIRTGDERDHLWGPERYSEDRARSAALRVATENWVLAAAAMTKVTSGA